MACWPAEALVSHRDGVTRGQKSGPGVKPMQYLKSTDQRKCCQHGCVSVISICLAQCYSVFTENVGCIINETAHS